MNAIFLPGDGVFHAVRWAVWRLYEDIEQDVLSTEPSGLDPISALLRSWRPSDSAKNPSLFSGRRKGPGRSFGLCVGLSCLPGQAKYCPAVKNSPVDCFRQKKRPKPKRGSLCWHYLSSRAVTRQVLSAQMSLTSVFGMGTGGPSSQSIPTYVDGFCPSLYVKRFLV